MTIDPEMLMAYADGELGPIEAKRVERAMADDPELAAQVDRHRELAASLREAFAPVERAPLPDKVEAMLRDAAKVTPLAPRSARRERPFWIGAMAASLVAGLFAAPLVMPRGDLAIEDGQAFARGGIARALDTQLAATQPADAATRIGVTFRDRTQRLCRSFEQGATGGIACAEGNRWRIERLYGGMAAQGTEYRQAGSATMMADAQAMMAGEPLDAAGEAAALAARTR
jgi:anti-sigma factor RsiW